MVRPKEVAVRGLEIIVVTVAPRPSVEIFMIGFDRGSPGQISGGSVYLAYLGGPNYFRG